MSKLSPESGLPQAVAPYVDGARRMTEPQFLQHCPHPFLFFPRSTLWDPLLLQAQASGSGGATKVVSYDVATGGHSFICPIRKRKTADEPGISLGRTSKFNDVVIPVSSVSSRHARFLAPHESPTSTWCVMDVGSSNGTWVNDEPIDLHKATPLENGYSLRFGGNLIAWFFLNDGLWKVLQDDNKINYYMT